MKRNNLAGLRGRAVSSPGVHQFSALFQDVAAAVSLLGFVAAVACSFAREIRLQMNDILATRTPV